MLASAVNLFSVAYIVICVFILLVVQSCTQVVPDDVDTFSCVNNITLQPVVMSGWKTSVQLIAVLSVPIRSYPSCAFISTTVLNF